MPISRVARTVPEPIRPPSGALAAWKGGGPGTAPDPALKEAAGAETQRVDRAPTLSMQRTGAMPPADSRAGRNRSSSSDDTVKAPLYDARETLDLPMNVGSDTAELTGPSDRPRNVPRTDPIMIASADAAAEGEGSSTIQVRISEDGARLEPEHGSPWYENPTLVTLLLGLAYPAGVAGILLSATWATRLQKTLALLSVALLSMGAVALLLGQ